MNTENHPVNTFYDSDEDVSWGPLTIREVKRNLKSKTKVDPTYRRQTAAFIPLPVNSNMNTANSSLSSKDYFTANESLDSNKMAQPENDSTDVSLLNSNRLSSNEFLSIHSDIMKPPETIELSSDSEDDFEIPESIHVKKEKISNTSFRNNPFRPKTDVISLSSEDEGDELSTSHQQDVEFGNEVDCSYSNKKQLPENRDTSLTSETTEKVENYESFTAESDVQMNINENKHNQQDVEVENKSSSISQTSNENYSFTCELLESPSCSNNGKINLTNRSIHDQMNINQLEGKDEKQDIEYESLNNTNQPASNQDNSYAEKSQFDVYKSAESSKTSSTHVPINISQNENEYEYCEEINHTLPNQSRDHSLRYSSILDVPHGDSLTEEVHDMNKFTILQNDENIQASSVENISEDIGNISLNDTFAEMERLLNEGYGSDSDDSIDIIIDSTPNKAQRIISKIPVPASLSDVSTNSSSSQKYDFKVPKLPSKLTKTTPNPKKLLAPKTSPSPLKNIVSPVRLYIKNSPFPTLKRNHQPQCTQQQQSQKQLFGSEDFIRPIIPKPHNDLLDSLPEVVYKPSKLIEKKCDNRIILPNNIRSLIKDRIVIKHEPRKRINIDESVFTIEEKLQMGDITHLVSDDHDMSVHTIKQGFNV